MTDRDRLIELVDKAKEEYANDITDHTETDYIVECLLNNGVILPPCKVGRTVYSLREVSCEDIDGAYTECKYYGFGTDDRICTLNKPQKCPHKYRIFKCLVTEYNLISFSRQWGKTVFLTKEEAEQALKERIDNG
jgi:hypothetical protein